MNPLKIIIHMSPVLKLPVIRLNSLMMQSRDQNWIGWHYWQKQKVEIVELELTVKKSSSCLFEVTVNEL